MRKSLFAALMLSIVFFSCKKEEGNSVHVAAPPGPPTTSQVSSVLLNGGNISGRWTMTFEQDVSMLNDTLVSFDTLTYTPGNFTVNFSGGSCVMIDMTDTIPFTYSLSGNHLTLNDGVDTFTFTYGISTQGVMRWYYTETSVFGNDVERFDEDYLFERY